MHTVRAMIRDGRVEPVDPLDLPEGTAVLVVAPELSGGQAEAAWDDSPAAIAAWLRWYDSLQPLTFTPEEQQARDQVMVERRRWELAHADARADRLRGVWP